ncbi:putative membrane protein [Propionispora sp. 2/2-37]|uniref:DUF2157 domain-containing protein n=1 Tax=Propionispora sp. 2/2-37 TaxID=1677858 RepID=UPI0006BB8274|nr:DUF2157 domain-containing protein [Propionispora sp. 2/2-37]CUH95023.1 putative membrane protein [Propionispora sp. 2/2-37]
MNGREQIEWLYKELPKWVASGIVTEQSAERIKDYYGPVAGLPRRSLAVTLINVFGIVLVGLGIILLIAHNWENLSRGYRMMIAISMLLIAQLIVGFVIWRKKEQASWREGAATLLTLMLGASIALVGQTYHIADDTGRFLLTWMLLSLSLVYLLHVTVPAVFYLIGITTWVLNEPIARQYVWGLLALIVPHYRMLFQHNRYANRVAWLGWVLTVCLYVSFGIVVGDRLEHLNRLVYMALFAGTFFLGILCFPGTESVWRNPFKTVGLAGGAALSFWLTFIDGWGIMQLPASFSQEEIVLTAVLYIALVSLGTAVWRKTGCRHLWFGMAPAVAAVGYVLQYHGFTYSSAILFNLYILCIGGHSIGMGIRQFDLARVNAGMAAVILLTAARFMDADFSFVARGVVFVLLGVAFLATNLVLLRKKERGES